LPDIIIKICENLFDQEFLRKESFKIEQEKIDQAIFTGDTKKEAETSLTQLKPNQTGSKVSFKDTLSDEVTSIESSVVFNLFNAIKLKTEAQNKSI
jgi:hypothetical protein